MKSRKELIFLNKSLNCLILKKKTNSIYFYNNKYFFFLPFFSLSNIFINKNLNAIIIEYSQNKNILKIINNIVNELTTQYYKKINFTGKGFKVKKKNKLNFFFFNNSHIKVLLEKKSKIIKNSKNSFLIFYKNKFNFNNILFLKNLFKLNIFTKKGIKFSRDLMLVKKIKKK